MRRRRRLWLVLIVILGVLGALVVSLKLYLASDSAARQAAERLEAALGTRATVGRLDVGFTETDLRNVQLFEAGPEAPPTPWAVIPDVGTDISLWGLVRGAADPQRLTLERATVTLRFDRKGKLLTRLPQPPEGGGGVRAIRIAGGRLILRQEGRPDLVVTDVEADLRTADDRLTLTGHASEERWGNGALEGWVKTESGDASLTIRLPATRITPPMLRDLPFVGPEVWQEVQADGQAAGALTLRFDPKTDRVHYRVEFDAQKTRLHVAAIDLNSEDAQGHVVIEDGLVQLREVSGQSAGGTITTGGELDFRGTNDRLSFKVAVDRLKLRGLPKKWFQSPAVQQLFDGRLTGTAELLVLIDKAGALTRGEGTGVIREARFAGVATEPIRLLLRAEGKGFRIVVPPPGGPGPRGEAPTRHLVDEAQSALAAAGQQLLATGAAAVAALRELSQRASGTAPSTLEIDLEMRDADLGQLVKGLDVQLPLAVDGNLACKVQVSIPFDTLGDLKTYRLRGTVNLAWVSIGGQRLEQVHAEVECRDGVLRLVRVDGLVPDGSAASAAAGKFAGTARFELFPAGDVTARLGFNDVPAGTMRPNGEEPLVRGACSGTVFFRAPLARLGETQTWQATARLWSDRLRFGDWEVEGLRGNFRVADGVLTAAGLHGKLEGAPIQGGGHLRLAAPYPVDVSASLTADAAARERLTNRLGPRVALAGSLHATATVRGTLRPFTCSVGGTGAATQLTIENLKLDDVRLNWSKQGDALRLTGIRVGMYRGEAAGEARWPLQAQDPGKIDFLFCDLDAAALTKDLGSAAIHVNGRISGAMSCTLSAEVNGNGRSTLVRADVQARNLRVEGVRADRLTGSVLMDAAGTDYRFTGQVLGGRFGLNGYLPGIASSSANGAPDGRLQIDGAQLDRLWEALGAQEILGPFRGNVALDMTYRHEGKERLPVGRGRFVMSRLRWGETELADTVSGDVRLSGPELRVRELSGNLGQGSLRGSIFYDLARSGRSQFNVALENVDAARLLSPWPALAQQLSGSLDVQVRGRIGPEWRGSGNAVLARGAVCGVEVVNWRLPFEFTIIPQEGRGQVEVRETSAQVAQGQATGRASVGWGTGARTEGSVRFFNVGLRGLVREAGPIGAGQVSGRLDFATSDARSLDDYTGTLDASFQQTQALQLPVLRQLSPFLLPGQSNTAMFQTGDVQARLGRGVVRVQRLRLVGSVLQLIVEGTLTLEGRLNLEATANTGGLTANAPFLRTLAAGMPDGTPLPIALLAQASRLLSFRLVHLRVGGTLRTPIVERTTLATLTEEAVRFFVGWAVRRP